MSALKKDLGLNKCKIGLKTKLINVLDRQRNSNAYPVSDRGFPSGDGLRASPKLSEFVHEKLKPILGDCCSGILA